MESTNSINELIESAKSGNVEAQLDLACCYKNGFRGVEQDYKQAVIWYKKSAEQGFDIAQRELGNCYYMGEGIKQDYKQAVKWFMKAAKQGFDIAQCDLGYCYYTGEGFEQNYMQAVEWFTKAAEQGFSYAQYLLGDCYYSGKGVEKDYEQAVEWFVKAAEQDYVQAQFWLGNCYYFGKGVEQDYEQAVKWYTKAAEQGNANSQLALGKYYYNIRGIDKDMGQALKYLKQVIDTKTDSWTSSEAQAILDNAKELIEAIRRESMAHRTEVFISYTRSDSDILKELKVSLEALRLNYTDKIAFWYDGMIETGQKWYDEIKTHMSIAKVAILPVSEAFLTSAFVRNEELPELLQAAADEEALIIWIPLEVCQVSDTIIKGKKDVEIRISDYQAAPKCDPKKPLREMELNDRKRIYNAICQDMHNVFTMIMDGEPLPDKSEYIIKGNPA